MSLIKSTIRGAIRLLGAIIDRSIPVYYKLKIELYKVLVADEAAAFVLYDSIRPIIILRMHGAKIGKNVRINRWLMLHESNNEFSNLVIGDDVHIGKNVFLDLSGKIEIGNRVAIGMFSKILTHQNFGDSRLSKEYPPIKGEIRIPDDVVVGAGVTVLFPSGISEATIIGAGSVVHGDHRNASVLIGNPARKSIGKHSS